jgi:hypothetical protein
MRLAIHQPYLFPYLGYFQLIHAVDRFVFFDDAPFRKQGWINRNRISVNGTARYFTVPLARASSRTTIARTMVDAGGFPHWRRRFLRTLSETCARAPGRDAVMALAEATLVLEAPDIASLASRSVRSCCEYLGLAPSLASSSTAFPDPGLTGVERVLDICRGAGATVYVNAPGGRRLYDPDTFARAGIDLRFLVPVLDGHPLPGGRDPGLSILEWLMWLDRDALGRAVRAGRTE